MNHVSEGTDLVYGNQFSARATGQQHKNRRTMQGLSIVRNFPVPVLVSSNSPNPFHCFAVSLELNSLPPFRKFLAERSLYCA